MTVLVCSNCLRCDLCRIMESLEHMKADPECSGFSEQCSTWADMLTQLQRADTQLRDLSKEISTVRLAFDL